MVLTSGFMLWMIIFLYTDYAEAPTATAQLPTRKPVTEIPFPAVGICSGNRMSRKVLQGYAEYLLVSLLIHR